MVSCMGLSGANRSVVHQDAEGRGQISKISQYRTYIGFAGLWADWGGGKLIRNVTGMFGIVYYVMERYLQQCEVETNEGARVELRAYLYI